MTDYFEVYNVVSLSTVYTHYLHVFPRSFVYMPMFRTAVATVTPALQIVICLVYDLYPLPLCLHVVVRLSVLRTAIVIS